jgi:hypothetical protein
MQSKDGKLRPVEEARVYFGEGFDETLLFYLENGVVYSDDELFVFGIKLNKSKVLERKDTNNLDKLDAWYVQYASGNIKRLFQIMPEELEWAIFERHLNEKPRCYKLSRIRRKLGA